ncbi:hypothetical protein [Oscillibacter sp.]|uniref:hypothetical protein n=1 Tax=Oscillibacter sp. TaxID=1945593 RepID=UPI00260DF858|nr:hypothetical protein [Oscillibacter sp.]
MADTLTVLQTVFGNAWHMICSVEVPGLGISFGAWQLAGLIISFMLALIRYEFGVGGSGQRSGQSRTKHISNERKNDEK